MNEVAVKHVEEECRHAVYISDEEPLHVQPNQPAAQPVDDQPQPRRSRRVCKKTFNSLNIDNL